MNNTSAHTYVGLESRPWVVGENPRCADCQARTCVTTQWVVGENPVQYVGLVSRPSGCPGQCCFCVVCALPMYNTSAHTYVGLVSRPSGWSEKIRVARIFVFSFCQAPWSMGQCCFCVVCALPMYNTSAHTYVGLVSRPSGWPEKIRVAQIFLFSSCQAPWPMGQCCFVLFAHCQCTIQVHTRT